MATRKSGRSAAGRDRPRGPSAAPAKGASTKSAPRPAGAKKPAAPAKPEPTPVKRGRADQHGATEVAAKKSAARTNNAKQGTAKQGATKHGAAKDAAAKKGAGKKAAARPGAPTKVAAAVGRPEPITDVSAAVAAVHSRRATPLHATARRPDDLFVADLTLHNLRVVAGSPPTLRRIDAARDAILVVGLPPQSFGEEAYLEATGPEVPNGTAGEFPDSSGAGAKNTAVVEAEGIPPLAGTRIRMAGPSRLAFTMPDGVTSVPYTLSALLDACRTWPLRRSLGAAPEPTIRPGGRDSGDLDVLGSVVSSTDFVAVQRAFLATVRDLGTPAAEPVLADFMSLTPDRWLSVTRVAATQRHVRVFGFAPDESSGHREAWAQRTQAVNPITKKVMTFVPTGISPANVVEVWVEQLSPSLGEDFGWRRVVDGVETPAISPVRPVITVPVRPSVTARAAARETARAARTKELLQRRQFDDVVRESLLDTVFEWPTLWDGTVTLPSAPDAGTRFRAVIAEYEEYLVDDSDTYDSKLERKDRRLVFVEHVELT